MKQTNKSDRFRRYLNRALLVFWVLLLALVVRACNQPAHAEAKQPLPLPTAQAGTERPTYWQAGKPLTQTAQTFYTTETPAKKTVTQKKAASRNGRSRPRDTQRTIAAYALL